MEHPAHSLRFRTLRGPARTSRRYISYWMIPVLASLVWLAMLLALLLHWEVTDSGRRFPSMDRDQTIAYISDVGAFALKPLFITMSTITVILLDLSFIAERYLRHKGRLIPNTSLYEKVLAAISIIFAIIGTFGLILLTIFDTYRHPKVHRAFLLIFIVGYLVSAICLCLEYWKLGIHNRHRPLLRLSFYIKLIFIVVELVLSIAFASLFSNHQNSAAVIEWIIAFIFTFYILSFAIDLWPAIRTRDPATRYSKERDHEASDEISDPNASPGNNNNAEEASNV